MVLGVCFYDCFKLPNAQPLLKLESCCLMLRILMIFSLFWNHLRKGANREDTMFADDIKLYGVEMMEAKELSMRLIINWLVKRNLNKIMLEIFYGKA